MEKILIVEDDLNLCRLLSLSLAEKGYQVAAVNSGREALAVLAAEEYDVVVLDFHLPDTRAIDLIPPIRAFAPGSIIMVMTAYGTLDIARECVARGAAAFILKPFNLDQVHYIIRKEKIGKKLREEESRRYGSLVDQSRFGEMVGRSVRMRQIYETVVTVAPTDAPVLILGETGTGKELVARAIHENSPRATRRMMVINCAALPEFLLESELFGHVKGAFTGAGSEKKGLVEAAGEGTIFLDEIGDLAPGLQAKLLRFLQDHSYRPVGGVADRLAPGRVLASTNRDLPGRIEKDLFRKDLYYRLNVISIQVPPLRERREDIPLLAYYFMKNFAGKQGKDIREIVPEALNILVGGSWEGNVRELEHTIERAVTFCRGPAILPGHLAACPGNGSPGEPVADHLGPAARTSLSENLHNVERTLIISALEATGWNKKRAAEKLGINPATLWKKMKRYQIPLRK